MFFQGFWVWLNGVMNSYIVTKVAVIANTLSPVIVTLATIYVMLWGYLMLTGQIKEPIIEGVKRIVITAVILGIAVNLWLYNGPIVNTFFQAPFDLAAAMVGAPPIAMMDAIWNNGYEVGRFLSKSAGITNGNFGYYLGAFTVWLTTALLCVYGMFLLVIAKVALSILLVLGPLFIALLFF